MSPDRDPRVPPADEPDENFEEEEAPRSIFSAAWFRVVLVLLGVAVVGAVAVPYVLDVVNPTPEGFAPAIVTTPAPPPTTPASGATARPETLPESPAASAPQAGAPVIPTAPPAAATAPPDNTVAEAPKPAPKAPAKKEPAADVPRSEPAPKAAAPARVAAARPAAPASARASEGGDYFVQVGAFKDQDTAKRVAARLRDQSYPVDESVKRVAGGTMPAPRAGAGAAPDRYDVIVSGGSAAEINTKLAAKGLASEPAGEGVRIRPSLPLRDAVALSKDLGSEGFKVQVRRGGMAGASAEPSPPAPGGDAGAQTLYRVRVGGYPDRATARSVQRELQEKGFQPFVAKGRD